MTNLFETINNKKNNDIPTIALVVVGIIPDGFYLFIPLLSVATFNPVLLVIPCGLFLFSITDAILEIWNLLSNRKDSQGSKTSSCFVDWLVFICNIGKSVASFVSKKVQWLSIIGYLTFIKNKSLAIYVILTVCLIADILMKLIKVDNSESSSFKVLKNRIKTLKQSLITRLFIYAKAGFAALRAIIPTIALTAVANDNIIIKTFGKNFFIAYAIITGIMQLYENMLYQEIILYKQDQNSFFFRESKIHKALLILSNLSRFLGAVLIAETFCNNLLPSATITSWLLAICLGIFTTGPYLAGAWAIIRKQGLSDEERVYQKLQTLSMDEIKTMIDSYENQKSITIGGLNVTSQTFAVACRAYQMSNNAVEFTPNDEDTKHINQLTKEAKLTYPGLVA